MGKRLEGHQNCLICHPELKPKWYKSGNAKGKKLLSHADARRLQDNVSELTDECFSSEE